ncbi:MAG TPA: CusA/CzcA family heavy metal efflux RND transporter, partial [Bacteroidales bacterium]|nr:CusA/CzcA family heavy metal efflux RND transporter [Bacteroidales bacterium]
LVKSLEDVEKIVVSSTASGIPVLIRDVATVQYGSATRYGAFVVDTAEAVGGVVMMLKGANAHEVIDQVEERIQSVRKSLPEGVTIEPYLNRSDLVGRAINTVTKNLLEGALIVIFILVLLLGNFRAGLIVASVIPLSMLFAVGMMNLFGVSGNLMSLGAIDFGLIVDGAVIIVESVVHRISAGKGTTGPGKLTRAQMDEHVTGSARRMMSSATFGQAIILIVYLPIMALIGIEGKMFRPMAQVVAFAIAGAAILSLTWVPMASALFLNRNAVHRRNFSDFFMEKIQSGFQPVIGWVLDHKRVTGVSAVLIFFAGLFLFHRLGGEFIPQLEEGDLAAGVITLQGGSLTNTVETVIKANRILLQNFPEIKHAVCKIGAGEIPTDPTPMETGDYIITLKDKKEWTSARTREELVAKMEEKLVTLAGVKFEFQQPIQMRFNELMTGSKQDVAVKIYGDDLDILSEKAAEVERIVKQIEGVEDINVEKVTGLAQVQVDFNRDRLAQYGLTIDEVNRALRTAFAGSQAGVVYDGEKRFALVVRLDRDYRQQLDDVKNLTVALPNGTQIAFDQIADVSIRSGPAQVSREDTRRRITVGFNVRNRDVAGVIGDVRQRVDRKVQLPTGYSVSYGGQFRNLEAARARLAIAVPVALLLIFVLLYFAFHSMRQTLIIFTTVPMSAIGGIVALWLRGMNFSISAGIGFIALFGVAVLNGIVLIAEFNRLEKEGLTDIRERILKGLRTRLRPVVITAAVASLGFLPMALSTSAGAEVQRPLATVVIGGLISATLMTLLVMPVFYYAVSQGWRKRSAGPRGILPSAILLLLALGMLHPLTSSAQTVKKITLQEAVQQALDSNSDIRSAMLEMKAQKSLAGASWDLPKTQVEGQYGQFNSYRKDNSLTVSQSFSFPGVYVNQHRLAKTGIECAGYELDQARLSVAGEVREAYDRLLYLHSLRRLLTWEDSLYAGFARAAERKSAGGETNRLEMLTARSRHLALVNRVRQVTIDISIAERWLGALLRSPVPVTPADTALRRIEIRVPATEAFPGNNPAVAISRKQAEMSKITRQLEQQRTWPDLSVGYFNQSMAGTQEVDGREKRFGTGDRFTGIQAGISLPLWIGPSLARIRSARSQEEAAGIRAGQQAITVQNEYLTLLDERRKYEESLDYYEKQALPEADLIVTQAGYSYQSGALDYSDYFLSLGRAMEIREGYLETLSLFNQTLIRLEILSGKIL